MIRFVWFVLGAMSALVVTIVLMFNNQPLSYVEIGGIKFEKECILKNLLAVTPKQGVPPGMTVHYIKCNGEGGEYTMYFRGRTQKLWDAPPRVAQE